MGTEIPGAGLPNFYDVYCSSSGSNKPMMLPETSAAYVVSNDTTGPTNLEVKQSWFKQLYNASRKFVGGQNTTSMS